MEDSPGGASNSRVMSHRIRWACLSGAILVVVTIGAVAGFASASTSTSTSSGQISTLRVITAKPHTETLDFPPTGKSPGDVYVFDATILSANGRTVLGGLRGTHTDIKIEHGMETVQGMLTYQLGTGNEIVVGGLSANPLSASGFLIKNKTFVRAVLGGTGKYSGASGTVTTKRLTSTRYLQVFRLSY
jgi:hypothetical protein